MFTRTAWLILAFGLSLSLTTQGRVKQKQPALWMSTPIENLVEEARASINQVTIQELRKAMEDKEDIVILDVSESMSKNRPTSLARSVFPEDFLSSLYVGSA